MTHNVFIMMLNLTHLNLTDPVVNCRWWLV